MALKDVTSYIKNMGKSVGYSMIDISKETAPAMAEFVDVNKDIFKDVYAAVKDHKTLIEKTKAVITGSKIYEAADLGLKATMEDIRTGNFYNKARIAEYEEKYSGMGMGDMDDYDIEFMSKDSGDDGSFGSVEISDGDRMVSNTIEAATKASADLTSTTIARSAEYMGKVSKINTNAIIVQNERLFGNLSNRIVAMHGGINDLYKLHATAIEATSKMNNEFFNNTTNLMRESNAMLKEILEMQRNMYKHEQEKAKQKTTYDDIVGSNGMPDLKEYAKVIKKNFKSATGEFGGMLDMFGKDSNMLAMFAASPLQFIPTFLTRAIIPAAIKSNMEQLDKTMSGIFGTAISRFNKMAKDEDGNGITKFIGKLFGINTTMKSGIDTSNYNKGAVPFDGITRKTIVEVIPGYLRRIEAILSGNGDERIYDPDKGKWTTASKLESQYRSIGIQNRNSAFTDVRGHATRYMKKAGMSKFDKDRFDKDFEKFLIRWYADGGYLPSNIRNMKNDYDISEDNFEIIKNILSTMNKGDLFGVAGRVMSARNSLSKTISGMEESGSSIYNYLFDGSEMKNTNKNIKTKDGRVVGFNSAVNIATVTDIHGNNVFFYLENIYKSLEWQRLNWSYGNGGGSRRRSGGLRDIKDSDWKSLIHNTKSITSSNSDQSYNDKINAGIESGKLIDFMNDTSDEAIAESMALLRAQTTLANIKDEDDRRKAYREKGYGILYSEQDDLDFGRYSHGKHDKGIVTRLREAGTLVDKFKVISEGISDFAKKPASVLASVLDKANQSIFSFFYQDPLYDEEGNKIQGFMDLMISKMKTTFNNFNKFLDEKILDPLKEKLGIDTFGDLADKFLGFFGTSREGIKDALFGEGTFLGDFKKGFKEEIDKIIDDVARTTKTAVAETYGTGVDAVFGTEYSTYGKAKAKDRKKYASIRGSLINYMAQEASFKKRENFGTDAEYEAYIDEQMGNEDIVNAAIQFGRVTRKQKKTARESRTSSDKDGAPQGTHAYGARMVTKAGLTMISPGEAIIPANMNPWNPNKDKVNLNAQLANEKSLKNKFLNTIGNNIGLNAKGTDGYGNPLAKSEPLGKQTIKVVGDGIGKTLTTLWFGDDHKQAKAFKEATGEITSKIKEYLPGMAATGLIGGGIGLLTGIGGPILGAVAGASIGLLRNSDKVQNWLFGKMGENGERDNSGVISKETQDAVKKYLPDLKNFGIAGALTGLFTSLGPVGGLMVGSALAYVKNNDTFADVLYGKVIDEGPDGKKIRDGGIFGKSRMDDLKKKAPNILGGAALGMLLGPGGGLLTKAAIGAGVGLLTSTDAFKTAIFGEEIDGKRQGGIVGALHDTFVEPMKEFGKSLKEGFDNFVRDDILAPISSAIEPIATEIRDGIKKTIMFIPNIFTTFMQNSIVTPLSTWMEEKIFNPLGKIAKFLLFSPVKLAKAVISAPFKAVGAIGDHFRRKQIAQGRAGYMTAQERLDYRAKHKIGMGLYNATHLVGDKYRHEDEVIANLDASSVQKVKDLIDKQISGGKVLDSNIRNTKRKIFSAVNQYFKDNDKVLFLHRGTRKRILKAIQNEKYNEAIQLIRTGKGQNGRPISNEERDNLLNELVPLVETYEDLKARKRESDTIRNEDAVKAIKDMGFKKFTGSKKDLKMYSRLLEGTYKSFESSGAYSKAVTGFDKTEGANTPLIESNSNLTDAIVKLTERIELLTDPSKISPISLANQSRYDSNLSELNEAIASGKEADMRKAANRFTELAKIYGKNGGIYDANGERRADIMNALINNKAGYKALLTKRKDGSNIKVGNIATFLKSAQQNENVFRRFQEMGAYMDLPEELLDKIAGMSDHEYAQLRTPVFAGAKLLNEDGTVATDIVDSLIHSDSKYEYKGTGKRHKGVVANIAHDSANAIRDAKNTFKGSVNRKFSDFLVKFQKLNLVGNDNGNICNSEQLNWLYKHAYYELDRVYSAKNPEQAFIDLVKKYKKKLPKSESMVSPGEAIIDADEVETNAFGKLGMILKDTKDKIAAKFKLIGSGNASGSKESLIASKKERMENERSNLMATGIQSISNMIEDWRNKYDKDQRDEELGNSGFWGKLLKGLIIGGKVLGYIGGGSLIAGLYKNYVDPIVRNVFDNHVKPWWSETAIPSLQQSEFGKSIIRGMDYITGSGEFAESGGLKGTISNGFDWFLGRGKYTGKGLLGTVKNFTMDFIVPNMFTGLEWIIGDLAPKILSGLFTSLPKLLGATVKGIGNFFKLTANDLLSKKATTYNADDFEISYDANITKSSNVSTKSSSHILNRWGLKKPASYSFDGTVTTSGISSSSSSTSSSNTNSNINAAELAAIPTADTEYYVNESGRTFGEITTEALLRGTLTKGGKFVKTFAKGGLGNKILKNTIGAIPGNWGIPGKLVSGAVGGSATALTGTSNLANKGLRKLLGKNADKILGTVAKEGTEEAAEGAVKTGAKGIAKYASAVAKDGAEEVAETASEKILTKTTKSLVEKGSEKAAKEGAEGLLKKVTQFLTKKLPAFFTDGTVLKMIKKVLKSSGKEATEQAAKKVAKEAAEKVLKKLLKEMGEKIVKIAAKALAKVSASVASAGIVTVAFIVLDFISGMSNANTILGVTKDSGGTSLLEKLLAGLINAITENLTFGLLPASTIVNIVIEFVAPMLGIDTSKLQARRQAAIDEIEKWNRENPENQYEDVESYNKKDKWTTKAWNTVKGWFGGGSDKDDEKALNKVYSSTSYASNVSGRGSTTSTRAAGSYGMGSGKQHFSQIDPRYANIAYNSSADTTKQTIKDSGCGPIAAAQVIQSYGAEVDPINAAKYAISGGYKETNGGTIPTFFRDYLAENSINTELLNDIKSTVSRIGSGQPVILMGTDSSNSNNTPYGKSPHYVVATGFDRRGNIIIQNPESSTPNSVYDAGSVLSKSSLAIGTSYNTAKFGKGSRLNKKLFSRIPRYGRAANANVMVTMHDGGGGKSSDYIGKHVKQFESGKDGSLSFTQCGNDWGRSFGSYQLTLRWGNAIKFLDTYFPEMVREAGLFFNNMEDFKDTSWPGAMYCSSPDDVEKVWRACYKMVGADTFFSYEWEFMKKKYYDPICNSLSDIFNPNTYSRAMQECIWSWAIHKGVSGCNKGFRSAIAIANISNPQTCSEAKLLKACYDYRHNQMIKDYPNNKRYSCASGEERDTVSKLIGKKPIGLNGYSAGTMTATKSSKEELNTLMDSKQISKAGSFSDKMGSLFDQFGEAVKNTSLYKLYESIFGSAEEEEEEEVEKDTTVETTNSDFTDKGIAAYADPQAQISNYVKEKVEEQAKKDGLKIVDPTNLLSPQAMLDIAHNKRILDSKKGLTDQSTSVNTSASAPYSKEYLAKMAKDMATSDGLKISNINNPLAPNTMLDSANNSAILVKNIKQDLYNRGIVDKYGTVKYCNRKLTTDNDYLNFSKNFTITTVGSTEFAYPNDADSTYINRLKSDVARATYSGQGTGKINSAIKGIIRGGSGNTSTSRTANLAKATSGYRISTPTINTSTASTPTINIKRTTSGAKTVNYAVDYSIILTAMVEILTTIADNTSAIQKIVDLLSNKLDIDTSSINTKTDSAKNIRAKLQSKLQEMNAYNRAPMSNNADTAALVNAMAAIAMG